MADLQTTLDALPIPRNVKADIWDNFQAAKDQNDFKSRFDKLPVSKEAKASLWDLKFASASAPVAEPVRGGLTPPPVGMPKAPEMKESSRLGAVIDTVKDAGKLVKDTASTNVLQLYGSPTFTETLDAGLEKVGDWTNTLADKALGSGTSGRLAQDFKWQKELLKMPGHIATGLLDFFSTPIGMATALSGGAPNIIKAGAGAVFGTEMTLGAKEAIAKAKKDPTPKNVTTAIEQTAMAGLPVWHAVTEIRGRKTANPKETEAPPSDQDLAEFTKRDPSEPVPFKSAAESADVFVDALSKPKTAHESAEVFARKKLAKPLVPETGIPESVMRREAARDEATKQLGVKWDELKPEDQAAIDDLISKGEAGSVQPLTLPKPTPIAAPSITVKTRTQRPPVAAVKPTSINAIAAKPTEPVIAPVTVPVPEVVAPVSESAIIPNNAVAEPPRPGETGTRERTPVLEPRLPGNPVGVGKATVVKVPNEPGNSYETQYEVRELADVQPSHQGHTFQENPAYQIKNERDYTDQVNQQLVIKNSGPEFDPDFLVSDNPTATNGPPVIDANGNTYGGNSRVMTLQRVYRNNPEGAARYRQSIIDKAAQFGVDPEQVAGMKEPVLVRRFTGEETVDARKAVTDLNKKETKELTAAEQATSDARAITPEAADYVSSILDNAGPETSLNEILSDKSGPAIVQKLIDDGVFNRAEVGKLLDSTTGAVTQLAKDRISKMLVGDFFRDSDQMQRTPPALKGKLERVAAPVMGLRGNPEWDIQPTVKEAISALEYAQTHGVKHLPDINKQTSMFDAPPEFSDQSIVIAQALRDLPPTKLAKAFKEYASDSRPSLFREVTREQALVEAFHEPLRENVAKRNGEKGALIISPQTVQKIRNAKTLAEEYAATKKLWLESQFIDRGAPLRDFLDRGALAFNKNAYNAWRLYSGHYGKIENRLNDLESILPKSSFLQALLFRKPKLLQDTTDYMTLERHIELGSRPDLEANYKIPGGRSVSDVQFELVAMNQRLGSRKMAEINQLAAKIRKYSDGLIQESADAGLISQGTLQAIRNLNQKYIPFERLEYLADHLDSMPHGSSSFNVPAQNVIKKISGSEREIGDPIQALVRQTAKIESLIERNKVSKQLGELANDPNFQGDVVVLGPNSGVPMGMEKLSYLDNGVKVDYAVPKGVGEVMKGMGKESADLVTKWASLSSSMLRAGATTFNLAFIPANALRDFQTATIASKVGFTPLDWGKGFAESIKHGPDYESFLESGGSFSGYTGATKSLPAKTRQLTQPTSFKVTKTIANPFELMRFASEHIEMAPRLGVFKRGLAQGLSPAESAFNARNATVDFAKGGNVGKHLNMWVPFLNARTQGTVNLLGATRRSPGMTTLKMGAIMGAPLVATYLYNTRNHKDVWDNIDQKEKDNNFIIITGDEQDENGNYTQVAKIPKGEVKAFGNPLESFLEYLDKNNPKALDRLAKEFVSDLAPVPFMDQGKVAWGQAVGSALPPAAKAAIEGVVNKNFYTGRELVPTRGPYGDLTKASPENQFTEKTPMAFKEAGRALGMSPLKLQNAVVAQFGGVGRQLSEWSLWEQVRNRFMGAHGGEKESKKFDALQVIDQRAEDEKAGIGRNAQEIFKQLEAAPPEKRTELFLGLEKAGKLDQSTQDAVERLVERKYSDLSKFESYLKARPLDTRAKYALEILDSTPPEQREKLFADWEEKKILTDGVIEAMEKEIIKRESAK